MKSVLEVYNLFDVLVAWPGSAKSNVQSLHTNVTARADVMDAIVREAAGGLKVRCEFVVRHCTFVQALCKNFGGGKEKAANSRKEACKIALDRAVAWKIDLKPCVRAAVRDLLGDAVAL